MTSMLQRAVSRSSDAYDLDHAEALSLETAEERLVALARHRTVAVQAAAATNPRATSAVLAAAAKRGRINSTVPLMSLLRHRQVPDGSFSDLVAAVEGRPDEGPTVGELLVRHPQCPAEAIDRVVLQSHDPQVRRIGAAHPNASEQARAWEWMTRP